MDADASSPIQGDADGGLAADGERWAGFTDVWTEGYQDIFAIRLVRQGAPATLKVLASPVMLRRWLALSFGPGIVTVVLLKVLPYHSLLPPSQESVLVLLLGLINAGMFGAAITAWSYPLSNAHKIDDLLDSCRRRDWIVDIIHAGVQARWQITLPLIFALIPWLVAATGQYAGAIENPASLLLLLNLTWALAILGNVSYWLIVAPWLVVRMLFCQDIVLRWHDPARTPGVRTLALGYGYTAVFLALGAVGVSIPRLLNDDLFGPALPYLYAWLVALSLWTGVFTQSVIYFMIQRFRMRLLDQLSSAPELRIARYDAPRIPDLISENAKVMNAVSAYNLVAAAPSLPFGTAVIVQYLTAIVGSLVGVLIH